MCGFCSPSSMMTTVGRLLARSISARPARRSARRSSGLRARAAAARRRPRARRRARDRRRPARRAPAVAARQKHRRRAGKRANASGDQDRGGVLPVPPAVKLPTQMTGNRPRTGLPGGTGVDCPAVDVAERRQQTRAAVVGRRPVPTSVAPQEARFSLSSERNGRSASTVRCSAPERPASAASAPARIACSSPSSVSRRAVAAASSSALRMVSAAPRRCSATYSSRKFWRWGPLRMPAPWRIASIGSARPARRASRR